MAQYGTLITTVGLAKIANAQVTQSKLNLTHIALGDGNGAHYVPTQNQTSLVNEVWRGPISDVYIHPDNLNRVIADAVISSEVGGFTIREIGLFDEDGDLIAVGQYPEQYKPQLAEGIANDLLIHFTIETSNADVVNLTVDPTVIIASRKYVDDKVSLAIVPITQNLQQLEQTVATHLDEKGQPNGYASLDESGKVPNAQLPPLDFIPVSQKGVSNGVATLGNDGLIPPEQIPDISSGTWEVLSSVSIDSPTNIIEFNNLPTDYDFFKIYTKNLMGDGTGSGYDSLFLRINDISANYSHNTWLNIQGVTSINLTSAQDTANSFQLTGALTKPSQIFTASFEVTIYNSANKEKSIIANGVSFNYNAPDTKITQVRVVGVSREIHDKTINKISITAGAQIKVGGKVILMGCKA